jgi:hypothetical protein
MAPIHAVSCSAVAVDKPLGGELRASDLVSSP